MFAALMFILMLGGGNNTGDLLDFTPTDAYWEMREQRIVDLDSMSAVLADDDATPVDKLMALRTLGEQAGADGVAQELKARTLLVLKPLVDSEEPFVAEYAQRSIAWVNGVEPAARPALPAEAYDLDLALLPSDVTIAGQLKIGNGVGPVDLAALIPDARVDGQSIREMMMQELLPGILEATQMIGNARADLVTAGLYLESEDDFWFMLAVRGQYDRVAVQLALEESFAGDDDASFYSVGEVEVVQVQNYDPFAMLMPSDDLFVILFSEDREAKLPIDAVAKKLAQADRKPAFDETLGKQVAAIDREKADLWLAMQVTPFMKDEPEVSDIFGAFDAARASAARDTEGLMEVEWVAEGSDEAAVGKAASFFTESIQEGLQEIKREKERMPLELQAMMDPVLKMLESMKFEHNGKTMIGGMRIDPGVGMTMPMMMFGMRAQAIEAQDAALVEEAAAE